MPRAMRQCPAASCTTLISGRSYCPQHTTTWAGPRTTSSRITGSARWKALVPVILQRDGYTCQIQAEGICTSYASVVDKIIPAARRPDLAYEPTNLRAACPHCNDHKARTDDRRRP